MFKIYYEDGHVEVGRSIDGSWKTIQHNKPITSLEYNYTWTKKLVLKGYKEYNHLVEKIAIFGGGDPIIVKIFIMGRKETETDIFTIDLKTRLVSKKTVALGEEYNGQETTGWKLGILNNPGSDNG